MEEESSSWLRRAKFSNTVCHRLDSSWLPAIPFFVKSGHGLDLKPKSSKFDSDRFKLSSFSLPVDRAEKPKAKSSIARTSSLPPEPIKPDIDRGSKLTAKKSFDAGDSDILKPKIKGYGSVSELSVRAKLDRDSRNSRLFVSRQEKNSTPKQRSASPLPTITIPDVFKEAKANASERRSSTPPPQSGKGSDRNIFGRLRWGKEPQDCCVLNSPSPPLTSPLQHFSGMKAPEKMKTPKDSSWARYFDHGVGRVTAVESTDEWMVDLSKLYLGLRFASGAHSRLYHGVYKDQPVAVKVIRQPDDDQNGVMAARLEKQFNREVMLLSHLYHRNVIKVLLTFTSIFGKYIIHLVRPGKFELF